MALLDRAIRCRLPEAVIAHRGFASITLRNEIDELVRDQIIDLAYVSTSLLQVVAEDFIAHDPEDERLITEILIPAGASIGALVAAPDQVRDLGELEILLPRGSRFQIVGVRADEHPPIIEMELMTR